MRVVAPRANAAISVPLLQSPTSLQGQGDACSAGSGQCLRQRLRHQEEKDENDDYPVCLGADASEVGAVPPPRKANQMLNPTSVHPSRARRRSKSNNVADAAAKSQISQRGRDPPMIRTSTTKTPMPPKPLAVL
jgi:hypothetical protein